MLVDSHCHIYFEELVSKLDTVFDNMRINEVNYALVVSVNKKSFQDILNLVAPYNNLYATVGLHPDDPNEEEFSYDELLNATKYEKVVGIGETGLDQHWCSGDLTWQHNRFITHIKVSQETNLPLVIHTRKAYDDTLRMLKEYNVSNAVIHCFTEDLAFAKEVLDLGLYISFSGIVTFKNAKEIQEACKYVPDDRILIETDSPFLAPVPFRGKVNEPSYVKHTAEFIANLRSQTFDHIAKITTDNFFNLFTKAKR